MAREPIEIRAMKEGIRTRLVPDCPLCGEAGSIIHDEVRDQLFGAPGTWRYRRCGSCGLLWQDPMVDEQDIGRLYSTYYTHVSPPAPGASLARRAYQWMREGYLAVQYGYPTNGGWKRGLGTLMWLLPGRRADADFAAIYLPASARGRLLDVGCGNGAALERLNALGWIVEGLDPDPAAVGAAASRGFHVRQGSIWHNELVPGSYDTVLMSHTIEHVHHPVQVLARARQLLGPRGTLIAVTPNAESLGHLRFGEHWRGLEPPRHLHIFSRTALQNAAVQAGFTAVDVRVTIRNARGIYDASRAISTAAGKASIGPPTVRAEMWQLWEWLRTWFRPNLGEELVLIASAP